MGCAERMDGVADEQRGEGLRCRILSQPGRAAFTGSLPHAAMAADAVFRGTVAPTAPPCPPRRWARQPRARRSSTG